MVKKILSMLVVLIGLFLIPLKAQANAAEPPIITIVISGVYDEVQGQLISDDVVIEGVVHHQKIETTIRFYRHTLFENQTLKDKVIFDLQLDDQHYEIEHPIMGMRYNQVYTLNKKAGVLETGKSLVRNVSLIGIRFLLTLLIEGLVFLLMKYRSKRTWLIFLLVNTITQGWLNFDITFNWQPHGYVLFGFVIMEIIILTIETIIYLATIKEGRKIKILFTSILANMLSMFLGGYLIMTLPL